MSGKLERERERVARVARAVAADGLVTGPADQLAFVETVSRLGYGITRRSQAWTS